MAQEDEEKLKRRTEFLEQKRKRREAEAKTQEQIIEEARKLFSTPATKEFFRKRDEEREKSETIEVTSIPKKNKFFPSYIGNFLIRILFCWIVKITGSALNSAENLSKTILRCDMRLVGDKSNNLNCITETTVNFVKARI